MVGGVETWASLENEALSVWICSVSMREGQLLRGSPRSYLNGGFVGLLYFGCADDDVTYRFFCRFIDCVRSRRALGPVFEPFSVSSTFQTYDTHGSPSVRLSRKRPLHSFTPVQSLSVSLPLLASTPQSFAAQVDTALPPQSRCGRTNYQVLSPLQDP